VESAVRVCEKCGQWWANARLRDPAFEANCELCGGRLVPLEVTDAGEDVSAAGEV
jgi:hypothetical protein